MVQRRDLGTYLQSSIYGLKTAHVRIILAWGWEGEGKEGGNANDVHCGSWISNIFWYNSCCLLTF